MRIAYVCADRGVPVFGHKGCSIHVQEVVRALAGAGAIIDLFATRWDGDPPADWPAAVRLHKLPFVFEDAPARREQHAMAVNPVLRETLQKHGPFDLVYERYSLWSYAAMEYAAQNDTPSALEVNAPLIEEQAQHRALVDREAALLVANRAFAAARAIIAVSHEVAAYVQSFPVARTKVHVISNGVNPRRFGSHVGRSTIVPHDRFVIGFVGSMKPWHDVASLIDAFHKVRQNCPTAHLLLIGDGKARDELESDAHSRGMNGAVTFTGGVAPAEIPALLAAMDVAVAPYPRLQNFYFSPLKAYEYMAAGLPMIASDIGTWTRFIIHGENGLLCPPGDSTALAAHLLRLHSDPTLRKQLGRAARETVLRDHTWDCVAGRILALAQQEQPAQ